MEKLGAVFHTALRMVAGTSKLIAFPAGMQPDGGAAQFMTQIWIGGVLEVFGCGLILIGLFTRSVAFLGRNGDGLFADPLSLERLAQRQWQDGRRVLLLRMDLLLRRRHRPLKREW